MQTNKIKRFATEARNRLKAGIAAKITTLGFDREGHVADDLRPELMQGGSVWKGEIRPEGFYHQWTALHDRIQQKGLREVYEEAAYRWFNRLVAIRILQKNGLSEPVLAYVDEARTPRIVDEARMGRMPQMTEEQRKLLLDLLDDDRRTTEQFALLITAFCHQQPIIHQCFGSMGDYTELLLPDDILAEGGFLDMLNETDYITDSDFRSPELIGWLYQFYISERKDEVFAKKGKFEADEIPAATQIFTPNWIVKYMVENTIGRIYLDKYPFAKDDLAPKWHYLVGGDASERHDVGGDASKRHQDQATLGSVASYHFNELTDLKVADLACGSGHILGEMFDLLYDLYLYEGYSRSEAIENILTRNLSGIDLDLRAKQLAQFALLLKACQKDAAFADAHCMPRVLSMDGVVPEWSEEQLHDACLRFMGGYEDVAGEMLEQDFCLLRDADSLGSIMQFNDDPEYLALLRRSYSELADECPAELKPLLPGVRLILALTDRYAALVMNPPYMGSGNMNSTLAKYVKAHYEMGKADLFSVFMLLAEDRLQPGGKYGMINMQSWMFLSSFEKLRTHVLEQSHIDSMLHLGPHTFDELSGEVVQNTAFVITNVGGDASKRHTNNAATPDNIATLGSVASYRVAFVDKKQYIAIRCGKLPHWFQEGRVQFITFRLADSLPQSRINEYKSTREQWLAAHPEPWDAQAREEYRDMVSEKMEKWLNEGYGSCVLARPDVRTLVTDSLEYYNGKRYVLHAYVVMPNHVHLLLSPIDQHSLADTIGSVKQFTANAINKHLGTTGSVWQREMFDRLVRDEQDFDRYMRYIQANPTHLPPTTYTLGGDASKRHTNNAATLDNAATLGSVASYPADTATLGSVAPYCGTYYRLVDAPNCGAKEMLFSQTLANPAFKYRFKDYTKEATELPYDPEGQQIYYPNVPQKDFEKIPGCPIGYWVSEKMIEAFTTGKSLSDFFNSSVGIQTGDNDKFLRLWYEISSTTITYNISNIEQTFISNKWFPYNKGGSFRRWAGNDEYVVNWRNDGEDIKQNSIDTGHHYQQYANGLKFQPMITWSRISSSIPAFRYKGYGFLSDMAGFSLYTEDKSMMLYVLAFINSKISTNLLSLLSPTLNFMLGPIKTLPIVKDEKAALSIVPLVESNISLSRADWDAHETSWDFERNPLLEVQLEMYVDELSDVMPGLTVDDIGAHYAPDLQQPLEVLMDNYKAKWEDRFMQLHDNEEELNRQFISIYGLEDELTPDVPLQEVTILQQGEITIEE